ncbi:DUF3099 domain-containing protein [Kineosporia succinea]|uniref:DUF3099 family protein n=1 Tax=Kineosporia succinea TaxID=84632 RepID=A0ABT9P7A9_9ACTN|nr:DUF3099 domain-containing protein [Kineosporia succinea]MDP9828583.1 hypothetical protein [Kineosporia succinea]
MDSGGKPQSKTTGAPEPDRAGERAPGSAGPERQTSPSRADQDTDRRSRGREPQPVHSITGALTPHSDDLDIRIRRYLISMSVRVLCVILAIVVHARWGHWSWWIFAIGAVILPYVAVVMANAVDRQRGGPGPAPITPQAKRSLPAAEPPTRLDDDVEITIHPPQRPVREEKSDSDYFEPGFRAPGPDSARFEADSARRFEQATERPK